MKKILILLSSAALLLTNCQDDFLDQEPSGMLSTNQLNEISKKDPESVLSSLVSGLYSTTFAFGTGGVEGHDDFGQKSIDITTDFMTGDFGSSSTSYGWFMAEYNFTSQIKTSNKTYQIWRYYYRLVKSANEVLDIVGEDPTGSEVYYGQAKAIRAYCYFYLVNLYQHPYSDKKDAPGVPVYTTQLVPEIHGQSKVGEVYDLIISDLEDAAEALKGYNRGSDKSKINRYVALGLLANVYLFRGEPGDYQKAAAAAKEVIDSGQFPLMSATDVIQSGFNLLSIPSWMWGIDLTAENSPALPTFWGHVDYYTYSYAYAGNVKIIDDVLYASIPATDVRKNQFGSPATEVVGQDPLAPIYKFYNSARSPGTRVWEDDEVYMRVEEMYLILAEAYARDNKTADAAAILKRLLDQRDTNAAAAVLSLSNSELLEAIYFNWRVEMWGEGKTYFAMKRYKKTVQRGQNHVYRKGEQFAYNYEYMIFAIPEREELNNPYLVPQQ